MLTVLEELQLTRLVTSITGLSAVGAAAILAQTGDPRRFASARALVKHAGLAPREKLSGTFVGRLVTSGPGAPAAPGSPTTLLRYAPCAGLSGTAAPP